MLFALAFLRGLNDKAVRFILLDTVEEHPRYGGEAAVWAYVLLNEPNAGKLVFKDFCDELGFVEGEGLHVLGGLTGYSDDSGSVRVLDFRR
jgi:hypothetical protein